MMTTVSFNESEDGNKNNIKLETKGLRVASYVLLQSPTCKAVRIPVPVRESKKLILKKIKYIY